MAADDGLVVVMDENTEEAFTAPGGEVEQLLYGYSLMCCLADGRSTVAAAATGTVMRPGPRWPATPGRPGSWTSDILPIEDDFFRFYRLR